MSLSEMAHGNSSICIPLIWFSHHHIQSIVPINFCIFHLMFFHSISVLHFPFHLYYLGRYQWFNNKCRVKYNNINLMHGTFEIDSSKSKAKSIVTIRIRLCVFVYLPCIVYSSNWFAAVKQLSCIWKNDHNGWIIPECVHETGKQCIRPQRHTPYAHSSSHRVAAHTWHAFTINE